MNVPPVLRSLRMREFYSSFLAPGDLAFDIGANHGDRVETFLALGARVVAVEPQPHCLEDLLGRFGGRDDVAIVGAAADERAGRAVLHLSNNDMVSSLSGEWIARVRAGGRFDDSGWDRQMLVDTVTLDALIDAHGVPAFVKIDVEGSELRVLRGLHRPVDALSFEYTPEDILSAVRCVERLESLGDYRFDLSAGETLVMEIGRFVPGDELVERLRSVARREGAISGDVYATLGTDIEQGRAW